jgi:hypothetical protein
MTSMGTSSLLTEHRFLHNLNLGHNPLDFPINCKSLLLLKPGWRKKVDVECWLNPTIPS